MYQYQVFFLFLLTISIATAYAACKMQKNKKATLEINSLSREELEERVENIKNSNKFYFSFGRPTFLDPAPLQFSYEARGGHHRITTMSSGQGLRYFKILAASKKNKEARKAARVVARMSKPYLPSNARTKK